MTSVNWQSFRRFYHAKLGLGFGLDLKPIFANDPNMQQTLLIGYFIKSNCTLNIVLSIEAYEKLPAQRGCYYFQRKQYFIILQWVSGI
jgi:hypothetical protein